MFTWTMNEQLSTKGALMFVAVAGAIAVASMFSQLIFMLSFSGYIALGALFNIFN